MNAPQVPQPTASTPAALKPIAVPAASEPSHAQPTLSNLDILSLAETAALAAWEKYRIEVEPLGLDFGQKMYRLREVISARGKDGEGLRAWLLTKGIPKSTAYYWINRYEISSGKCDLREKYAEFEKEYDEGWAKVKNGEQSLSTFVRTMDWLKNGQKTEETPFTVGGAAQTFLRLLSYETALPTYQERRAMLHSDEQELFDEAWGVVREGIYATSL